MVKEDTFEAQTDEIVQETVNEDVDEGALSDDLADEASDIIDSEQDQKAESNANTPFVPENVSPEELDKIADTAVAAIQSILKHFDAADVAIDEFEGSEGELILNVDDDNLAILIGKFGTTLDAIQTIVSAITSREIGYFYPITVDVGNYRQRQRDKVTALANSNAEKAIRLGKAVELLPMGNFERRLVHMVLKDNPAVETYSEGSEPQRFVVIEPLQD